MREASSDFILLENRRSSGVRVGENDPISLVDVRLGSRSYFVKNCCLCGEFASFFAPIIPLVSTFISTRSLMIANSRLPKSKCS